MIRGYLSRSGHEAIPDENIDEPLNFYLKSQTTMLHGIKQGDDVLVTLCRNNTDPVIQHNNLIGRIISIDTDNNRTMFPFGVETSEGFFWAMDKEVALASPEANTTADNIVLAVVMIVLFCYSACGINAIKHRHYLSPIISNEKNV